jgi:hypothetical protein
MRPMTSFARLGAAGLALGLFAAAMWFAWLGWDNEYYEVDGVQQGPYEAWQVVGCGISICLAAVAARVWAGGGAVLLAGAATVGFAIPWALYAAADDDSGLWAAGLVFLVVGAFVGLVVLLTVSEAVMRRSRSD